MESKKHVFSYLEKKTFIEILKRFSKVVENKKTDGATLAAKNNAWERITMEYNANPYSSTKASTRQLRRLWCNLKQRQRDLKRQHCATRAPVTNDTVIESDDDATESDLYTKEHSEDVEVLFPASDPLLPHPPPTFVSQMAATPESVSPLTISPQPHPVFRNKIKRRMNQLLDRKIRVNEIHELEKKLLREHIREAKAKADLAELLLQRQSQ